MAANLVQLAEIEISGTASADNTHRDNVTLVNSSKGYTLNIDRTLRKKINACTKVSVDYNFTGGGITGEMDTATFELFRAACTTFYSRLPTEQGQCEKDICEDKHRKAVVQQTYKVKFEVSPGQTQGYTINLYTTRNRILINGKNVEKFMDEHLPAIHELMMKPIHAGIVTGATGLNNILRTQMQALLDQRNAGIIPKHQLLPNVTPNRRNESTSSSSSSPEPPKCSVCKRFLRTRGVECEKGQHWVHYHCDKLTQDEIDRLHTDKGVIFNCKQCSKDDTLVKVPVESKQTSAVTLKLPKIRHDNCAQAEHILNDERVSGTGMECGVCGNSIGTEAVACLKCNINCHKECMEHSGIDYLCLNCKSVDMQTSTQLMTLNHSEVFSTCVEVSNHTETKQYQSMQPNLTQSGLVQQTKSNENKPETVSQINSMTQNHVEQENKVSQINTMTQNPKPVNNNDGIMKQRELRQWEQKLRKREETLKLKEMKGADQDNEKQRLHDYINKLEARNDELTMTINTLQRRIDILETPLNKTESDMNAGYKEPQRSAARREEVDDLIIGVRERVTRFVLGRVSEQLDALENREVKSGFSETRQAHVTTGNFPMTTPNNETLIRHELNNQSRTLPTNYRISNHYTERHVNQHRHDSVNMQTPDRNIERAVNITNSVNNKVMVNRHITSANLIENDTNMVSQHLGPQYGWRQNAISEPVVRGSDSSNFTVNPEHLVGQPLIKTTERSQQPMPNQHFLYMAMPHLHLR